MVIYVSWNVEKSNFRLKFVNRADLAEVNNEDVITTLTSRNPNLVIIHRVMYQNKLTMLHLMGHVNYPLRNVTKSCTFHLLLHGGGGALITFYFTMIKEGKTLPSNLLVELLPKSKPLLPS